MKSQNVLKMIAILALVFPAACAAQPTALPSETPTATVIATLTATPTLIPSDTPTSTITPTLVPTDTPQPTPTYTLIPFPGFNRLFDYYKGWIDGDHTYFYFLNAQIPGRVYGTVEGTHNIVCDLDPKYPKNIQCVSDYIEWDKSYMEFTFYADESHTQQVYQKIFYTEFGDEARNIPTNCESEYRIYDGKCYYAITCYDQYGNYLYSMDNIPYGGHFEGYSAPCPP